MRDFHFEASKVKLFVIQDAFHGKQQGTDFYLCLLTPKMFESMQDKVRVKLESTLRTFEERATIPIVRNGMEERSQTYTTEPVSCYPATFQLNPLPDSLGPFFWRQVKAHTQLHVLWHRDDRLMWMGRIRISKGQTLICATASCNELEASNRQMRFEKWWFYRFTSLIFFVTAGSFRIIQVKCVSKSS